MLIDVRDLDALIEKIQGTGVTGHDWPHRICDLVTEHLALSEAELRERVAELEADVRAYRELARAAVHALHDLTVERTRLRERLRSAIEELRKLHDQRRRMPR